MAKIDYVEFQARTQPLAFLITFRCYGTWLHGDKRGAVDRSKYHRYGTPDMPANQRLLNEETLELIHPPVRLNPAQRELVALSVREVCTHRNYLLHALNLRTNHVHSVVSAPGKPETVMDSFKAYATRKLRQASLIGSEIKPWARHGSTEYLWTEEQVDRAVDYVVNGQGDE
jgi:REP element-mobilizing transposase RayT